MNPDVRTLFARTTMRLAASGPVVELTFTRPDVMNRFDADAHGHFGEVVEVMRHLPEVRAGVISSTGPVFSAGGDYDYILQAHDDPLVLAASFEHARSMLHNLLDIRFPLVAAVQGAAIGLGATIALACDLVVASRNAMFGDPHVLVGLAAGDGGCVVWPHSAGATRAKRYLLTGDQLCAEDAYAFGLVTDLVDEPDEARTAAVALARRLASLPPMAVQGTKRAIQSGLRASLASGGELAFLSEVQCFRSDDVVEAVAAARERRTGDYAGR